MTPAQQPSKLRTFLRYDRLDLTRIISSNLVSANALFLIRLFVSLHLSAVFIATLYVSARDEVFYMVFTTFTNLSNIGLTAYYLTVTYHSYSFNRHRDLRSLTSQHWLLTSALGLLYASVVVFHIVVPAIYWSLLFDPNNTMDTLNEYVDYSHHGVDFACILIEMIFNRMELPWVYILGPISMIILYMFLAWVYFAVRGLWLYSFLDWSNGAMAAAWYIALLIGFALLFVLQKYIHQGRDRLTRSREAKVAACDGTDSLGKKQTRVTDEEICDQKQEVEEPFEEVQIGGDKQEVV
ncbi:hypothetical protein BX616_004516 [Lobosporangium transversale]|uniref:FAR-17a/AIG1-like protein-domain-containing protein n=1 Tax=Lobosporangium transversale TaxID=64571 RepID=A0A1Y2GF00_9FUNG|nr:hypothetical protein BCR41DRAFT_359959 [Lobosporangium transversale]KAF9898083.1 hypothetical protein BX616_004516 [Lobosporangium transversale]ORZ07713.1 hypothetical protein BCR41DRAFT_359959 [Lobosporangium transversale]|eukprot:XP_021878079.1 hypothetical protein BCR41DRAFT_359959 [Lobosporangium transversale]